MISVIPVWITRQQLAFDSIIFADVECDKRSDKAET